MSLSRIQILILCGAIFGVSIAGYFILRPGGTISGQADANNLEQVAMGKIVYAENCAACHGVKLEGQENWRQQLPEGGLPAPPHDETGHTWHHPDRLNFKYTKLGGQTIAPKGFKSNMPAFGEIISDEKIWSVLAFIKSNWPAKIRRRQQQFNGPPSKK